MSKLLEVKNLKKYFKNPSGLLHAVDDVTFSIDEGKTLGVVGESGCGKSTLGRTIIHLIESTGGQIFFEGEDVTFPNRKKRSELCSKMQIIFQDPFSSLNPRMSVSQTIMEPLMLRGNMKKEDMIQTTKELMETVGLADRFWGTYPHELDGGRRQRIGIARALALNPKFIVCDEPVSALDVSIQAQILNLLVELQQTKNLTYMFVTHDLSVVKYISEEIIVMYLGQIVEKANSQDLFTQTLHPYSKALLSAIPIPNIHARKDFVPMKGEITSPINPKPGCRFLSRCPNAAKKCSEPQVLEEVLPNHFVSCCMCRELNGL